MRSVAAQHVRGIEPRRQPGRCQHRRAHHRHRHDRPPRIPHRHSVELRLQDPECRPSRHHAHARTSAAIRIPSPTTSDTSPLSVAPSAERTASSRVRCSTPCATTPYRPIAASSSATAPNTPIQALATRCGRTCSSILSATTLVCIGTRASIAFPILWIVASGTGPPFLLLRMSRRSLPGCCAAGRYATGGGSSKTEASWTSLATPTTRIAGRGWSPRAGRESILPSALSPGHSSAANRRLTTTTGSPPPSSLARKPRPRTMGRRRTSKNPGETTFW